VRFFESVFLRSKLCPVADRAAAADQQLLISNQHRRRVASKWNFLYRAVDKHGKTVHKDSLADGGPTINESQMPYFKPGPIVAALQRQSLPRRALRMCGDLNTKNRLWEPTKGNRCQRL
jgi:hypothetical protein